MTMEALSTSSHLSNLPQSSCWSCNPWIHNLRISNGSSHGGLRMQALLHNDTPSEGKSFRFSWKVQFFFLLWVGLFVLGVPLKMLRLVYRLIWSRSFPVAYSFFLLLLWRKKIETCSHSSVIDVQTWGCRLYNQIRSLLMVVSRTSRYFISNPSHLL